MWVAPVIAKDIGEATFLALITSRSVSLTVEFIGKPIGLPFSILPMIMQLVAKSTYERVKPIRFVLLKPVWQPTITVDFSHIGIVNLSCALLIKCPGKDTDKGYFIIHLTSCATWMSAGVTHNPCNR